MKSNQDNQLSDARMLVNNLQWLVINIEQLKEIFKREPLNFSVDNVKMDINSFLKLSKLSLELASNTLSAITHSAPEADEQDKKCPDCNGSGIICITLGGVCETSTKRPGSDWCLNKCAKREGMKPCPTCKPIKDTLPEKVYCEECEFYRPAFASPFPQWIPSARERCIVDKIYDTDYLHRRHFDRRHFVGFGSPAELNSANNCQDFKEKVN